MAHNLDVRSSTTVEMKNESGGLEVSGGGEGSTSGPSKVQPHRRHLNWIDGLLLLFLAGLAALPPVKEPHKQIILAAIALVQLFEARLVRVSPRLGPCYAVILKILLATVLLDHTGEVA